MSEDRIVTRSIPLSWGGGERYLPVLPMKPADEWRRTFAQAFPDAVPADGEQLDAATMISQEADKLVEVLLAYDKSGVLGDREWIAENVTDDEVADAFLEVWRRSFRLSRLPIEMIAVQSGRPQPARSLNGRSPTGISTPTP